MGALQAALDELYERTSAMAGLSREDMDPDDPMVMTIEGDPYEMLRTLISGYIPVEETDHALNLLADCSVAMTRMVGKAPSPRALDAGLRFTVAQLLIVGVALERGQHAPKA